MNKFELINVVTLSDLKQENKPLLTELIMRSDDEGLSWPSVERLCKARGIKHEKNFKGADVYLPGLVTKVKRGRKNNYVLNVPAILALDRHHVVIKHTDTPAVEGVNTPAVADNTPALADNTPAAEGANNTENNTENSTEDSTRLATPTENASRPPSPPSLNVENDEPDVSTDMGTTTNRDTPAVEGVLDWESGGSDWWYAQDKNMREKVSK